MKKNPDDQPSKPVEQEQANPFLTMGGMLTSSLGKLPTGLVAIFLGAVLLSIFAGVGMKYAEKAQKNQPVSIIRLTPSSDAQTSSALLQGVWVNSDEEYAMGLSIVGNKYEWIVSLSGHSGARFFSRGVLQVVGDVLVLETRDDMGYPFDKDKRWIDYLPVSMKNLNIRYDVAKRKMVWTVPQSEFDRVKGPVSKVVRGSVEKPIIWTRQ